MCAGGIGQRRAGAAVMLMRDWFLLLSPALLVVYFVYFPDQFYGFMTLASSLFR